MSDLSTMVVAPSYAALPSDVTRHRDCGATPQASEPHAVRQLAVAAPSETTTRHRSSVPLSRRTSRTRTRDSLAPPAQSAPTLPGASLGSDGVGPLGTSLGRHFSSGVPETSEMSRRATRPRQSYSPYSFWVTAPAVGPLGLSLHTRMTFPATCAQIDR